MSLITRLSGVTFSNPNLPKLYLDALITSGTKFLYDAKNPKSWPKQDAPLAGSPSSDKLVNLVNEAEDGLLYALSGGWAANGGFVSDTSANDKISALNNATPAVETKVLGIVWIKHTAGGSSTNNVIADFGDMLKISHTNTASGNVPANRFFASGNALAGREIIGIGDTTNVVGDVFQIALSWDNAERAVRFYVNGVYTGQGAGYRDLQAPNRAHTLMQSSGSGVSYQGTFYRWFFDDLSGTKTAEELVAIDWANNSDRFT